MNEYTFCERTIANILARFPRFKRQIKRKYQTLSYILSKKIKSNACFPMKKISYLNQESFFGYYDKSPLDITGRYIIFNSVKNNTKFRPGITNGIDIILNDTSTNEFNRIDETSAFNWQQGCRLQWLNNGKFIFNRLDKENKIYKARIYCINENKIKDIDYPIYDCNNENAISLDFERLYLLNPDYGYLPLTKKKLKKYDSKDGIYLLNLINNRRRLILSYSDIIDIHEKKTMKNAIHKINHLMLSPDGNSFIFLHRWYQNGIKYDALLHYDILNSKCICLSDHNMVSHCCWIDNYNLIGWLRKHDEGDKYYSISILDRSIKMINEQINHFGDGHPSVFNNNLLFDTYPDKSRMKKLFLFNFVEQKLILLGTFYESLRYYEATRCDLHPKWAANGRSVFIDSVHENKRYLYELDVK
jgi:hypothetical protein